MKLAWATDIHLNWVADEARRWAFYASIVELAADALLLTGDIADGPETSGFLTELARAVGGPIYFVLGNHDFYGRSIVRGRQETVELVRRTPALVYLTASRVIGLTASTALVGHDSWADGRLGDFAGSRILISDFTAIEELAQVQHDRGRLRAELERLGDEAAAHFAAVLPEALDRYREVVVATHAPPFRESARYAGEICEAAWLPFFACKAVGDVLYELMRARPDRRMLVYCGHTHGGADIKILPNLRVITGEAREEEPCVGPLVELD